MGKVLFSWVFVVTAIGFLAKASAQETKWLERGKVLIEDRFSEAEFPARRAARGRWTFEDGIAKCTQEDALFEQFKNHGPVLWYGQGFRDGIIEFEFRSDGVQNFVFTINGSYGHVFRFVINESGTNVRAWDQENHSSSVASGGPKLVHKQWIPVRVELAGRKAQVRIGPDYCEEVESSSYASNKTVIGLGFSYGTLEVRNFVLTAGVESRPAQ